MQKPDPLVVARQSCCVSACTSPRTTSPTTQQLPLSDRLSLWSLSGWWLRMSGSKVRGHLGFLWTDCVTPLEGLIKKCKWKKLNEIIQTVTVRVYNAAMGKMLHVTNCFASRYCGAASSRAGQHQQAVCNHSEAQRQRRVYVVPGMSTRGRHPSTHLPQIRGKSLDMMGFMSCDVTYGGILWANPHKWNLICLWSSFNFEFY